ncbi:hypothetical protein KR059_003945, partial [Drosophila kikkawai]
SHQGYVCTLYELRFQTLEPLMGDTETLIDFKVRLVGRERLINGTLKCYTDIDNEFEWKINIEQHINGDWKPLLLKLQFKTCAYFEDFYTKYWASSFVDTSLPKDACPLKKGEYYLKNIRLRSDNMMRFVKQGLNRIQLTVSKNNIITVALTVLL